MNKLRSLFTCAAAITLICLFGQFNKTLAGRIELDNPTTVNPSNIAPVPSRVPIFARFFAGGETQRISFGSIFVSTPTFVGTIEDVSVGVYTFRDFGIDEENFAQIGSLLQTSIVVPTASAFGSGGSTFGSVALSVINPADLTQWTSIGSISLNSEGFSVFTPQVFSLNAFGALPSFVTPDFFFRFSASFGGPSSFSNRGSITIQSNATPTPEPATLLLLGTGLGGLAARTYKRRQKHTNQD